jgi:hypothetical protein
MKKKYLVLGSFALLPYSLKAQVVKDTLAKKVRKTEIELVYNHYLQDGNNSAVTGGVGTEKLVVYGPSLTVKKTFNKNALSFNLGADIISSASTDNIDFIKSSASEVDARMFTNLTYERMLEKSNASAYGGIGFSIESDYFSIASKLGFTKTDELNNRTYSFQFQMFNDDLRWGRLNPDHYEPVELVYPFELRSQEWYSEYRRNSYNLKLGLTQVINKRNIFGVFPELTYQKGLLATPFHRIYFADDMLAVENLPNQRYKGALALKLNSFVGGRFILRNTINGYVDNFGIQAIAIENETAIKLKPFLVLLPNFRFYAQNGTKYFAPYMEHQSGEEYYTSDYDLSKFETYNVGIGLKHTFHKNRGQVARTFILRYNFLYRTNDLKAHSFSLIFQSISLK